MLHSISELREHQPEEKSVNKNGALPLYHTLALLHTVLGDKEKVSFSQSENSLITLYQLLIWQLIREICQ